MYESIRGSVMQLNLAKQLREHIDRALDCRSKRIRYEFKPSELSAKYYAVPLSTYWGELLPEEYQDKTWLSLQPIAFQKQFWSAYFLEGVEVAIKKIWRVNGEIVQNKTQYVGPKNARPADQCSARLERLELNSLTLREVRDLCPRTSEAIVRESLLEIGAVRLWSATKNENVYSRNVRA